MPHLNEPEKERRSQRLSVSSKPPPFIPSPCVPERFKDGDDAQEDVAAPPRSSQGCDNKPQLMQQSIFSIIAAAGTRSDFHTRFDDSSDSDEEVEKWAERGTNVEDTTSPRERYPEMGRGHQADSNLLQGRSNERREKHSESRLVRSHSKLHPRQAKAKESVVASDPISRSSASASSLSLSGAATPRAAPVLSRMIEAQTRFDPTVSPNEGRSLVEETDTDQSRTQSSVIATNLLSTRLMEIFGLEKPEKVLGEYACWLLQSILLQGYMYVTEGHICFYAYLSKKGNTVVKSGHLAKRGRKNPKYNRYWFSLKGDVLSYYADPSNLYFPSGHIDLRYGISASLVGQKGKETDIKDFTVTTDQRTYYFRADSATSAKEWVKALQKVIFRSLNEGDSVKISFPVENVIDIEESPMIDFAETFKIRVVDSGETYAIDEYFFSFFNLGEDGRHVLKSLVNGVLAQPNTHGPFAGTSKENDHEINKPSSRNPTQPAVPEGDNSSQDGGTQEKPFEPVMNNGHTNADGMTAQEVRVPRRSEVAGRLSLEQSHHERNKHPGSADSFVHSFGAGTDSSVILQSAAGTTESASQILNRSDVFRSPTLPRAQREPSDMDGVGRRTSQDTARSISRSGDAPDGALSRFSTDDMTFRKEHESQGAVSESEYEPNGRGKVYSMQEIVKAGAYPLQRAAGFAEYLKSRSKQMSSLLAAESMGYIEKVSGMWAGGGQHYGEGEGVLSEKGLPADPDDDGERGQSPGDRFRAHFALPPSEKLQATYYSYLHRVLPLYGKIYISHRKFCFRSLIPGTRTKLILPLKDIENVEKETGFRFGYHGLVIIIRGHEELFFEFNASEARDDCNVTLHQILESVRFLVEESSLLTQQNREEIDAAQTEHQLLQEARLDQSDHDDLETHPIFDDPRASILNFKPTEPLRITCLTIGSRGDVQPYIALCKGLLTEGHRPRIATHREFEPWVRRHGIDFSPVEGEPAKLMQLCTENGMFTYAFLKEASNKFRGFINELLSSAWAACQESDVLIESPSTMAGIHIAEALRIPYFRSFTMPWTRTRAYPHAFAVPEHHMGGAYNYITYVMIDNVFWKAISGQVNRWRHKELGLRGTTLDRMQPNKVPFLYNFSPSVVPPPLDYPDWIRVTGYWFLDEGQDWTPPTELCTFIERARHDGKKIVYIGFGSIVVSDPAALTRTVIDSIQRADVRCILSKGWSDRLGDPSSVRPEIPLPSDIYQIVSAPHDWLFRQVDAVAHHGGSGTTGASLRAGVPTIIKPFFGDQFFSGSRVEDLGVGICMKKLNVSAFSRALWEATHDERMIARARRLGEQIREECGVTNAIQAIYRDLEYATTLTRQRSVVSATPFSSDTQTDPAEDDLEDIEETWTFIGDDTDLDLSKRVRDTVPLDAR